MSTVSALASAVDKKKYNIKILEDKEFDALPFKRVKESLGCADRKTMTAYVRKTHWGEASKHIDALTLQHELEELVQKNSDHEDEDGIRYKGFKSFIKPVIGTLGTVLGAALGSIVPGVGTALGATLGGALGGAAGSAGGGAIVGERGSDVWKSAGIGALGGALGGAGGAANILPGVSGTGYLAGAGAGAANAGANSAFNVAPMTGASAGIGAGNFGSAASALGSSGGSMLSSANYAVPALTSASIGSSSALGSSALGSGAMGGLASGLTGQISSNVAGAAGTPAGIQSALSQGIKGLNLGAGISKTGATFGSLAKSALKNPTTLLGIGSLGISAMPITPQMPNIGEITAKWLTPEAITKSGQMAKDVLQNTYAGDFAPAAETTNLISTIHKDIDKQYKQRIKDMDRMGAVSNPNWAQSGERLDLMRRTMNDWETEKNRVETEMLSAAQQEHATRRYQYVMQEWNVDEQVKRDFLYADLADVMSKYNAKSEDVLNLRKIAADAGMYMLAKGTGIA